MAFAALVFAAAFAMRRYAPSAPEPTLDRWIAIAMIAAAPGVLIGWTIENIPLESLGFGGWMRSLAFAALAIAAPIVCAAGARRERRQRRAFASLIGPTDGARA